MGTIKHDPIYSSRDNNLLILLILIHLMKLPESKKEIV